MPSKAFKLAEAMVSNPVMSDIVTDTTAVPVSITNQIEVSTDQGVTSVEDLPNTGNSAGDIQLVEATNRLYVWNGSGWYNIALINTTPAWDSGGQPAASYELDADSPQTATSITLAATDPEGLPISYTYVTSGQMDSIATVSQDSSVFTITPKTSTQVPDGGTGSITFRASDGINILPQVSSFTLTFSFIVSDSNHTTLLATATGGSDNNNITDASTNNHSITVDADTYAGTFSPYRSGGYSVHLDDGEEISFPDSPNYNISNGLFSIEAWVNPTSYDSPWSGVISQFSSSSRGWGLAFSSTQITFLGSTNGGSSTNVIGSVTSSVPLNQWTHLLVTRDSNTIRIFKNGVLINSFTESGTFNNTTNPLRIGELNSAASENFRGYIRDARVVKGSIPTEYQTSSTTNGTTIFTAPSEPLTAVTNTVLLTCHLPYISDGSANDATPTLSGNVSAKPFSPYDYLEYSATDHGGSVFLGGTAHDSEDRLEITRDTSLTMGSGDFTYEAWVYLYSEDVTKEASLFSARASGYESFVLKVRNSGTEGTNLLVANSTGSGWSVVNTKGGAVFANVWTHVAIVRSSTSIKVYTNGKEAQSHTFSGSLNEDNNTLYIGYDADSRYGLGHVSDVRITKGTAVYTTEFTPPTAPLSSSGASLHIKGTDASIIDKSQTTNIKLVGGTNGTTTQAKFANTRSMYFDESGDHIDVSEGFIPLRTSDFTIETWFYPTANPSNHEGIFSNGTHNSGNWLALLYQTNRKIRYDIGGGSSSNISTTAVSLNTWCHIALCRSGGNIRLYINGTQEHTEANSSDLDYETARIGDRIGLTGYALNSAYLQDFRITKGLARYTATDETSNIPSAPLEG